MSANFTSQKLNWLKAVHFDRRVTDSAYSVAACLADHLNEGSWRAFLSDETIAFEIGSTWPRKGRPRAQIAARYRMAFLEPHEDSQRLHVEFQERSQHPHHDRPRTRR